MASLRGPQRRFLVTFGLLLVVLEVGYRFWLIELDAYQGYLAWNAELTARITGLLGYGTTQVGRLVVSDRGSIEVVRGCDALQPAMLFTCATLALPAAWRGRMLALLTGLAVLFVTNLARLVTLFMAYVHAPDAFELLHVTVWPVAFILVVLLLWVACLGQLLPAAAPPPEDAPSRAERRRRARQKR